MDPCAWGGVGLVTETLTEALDFLRWNWKRMLWYIRGPAIIYLALILIANVLSLSILQSALFEVPGPLSLLFFGGSVYPTDLFILASDIVSVSVVCLSTRLAFFGIEHGETEPLFSFGWREVRYIYYVIVLALFSAVLFLPLFSLVFASGSGSLFLLAAPLAVFLSIFISVRLFLVFPGAATGAFVDASESWRWMRGSSLSVFLIYLLLGVASSFVTGLVASAGTYRSAFRNQSDLGLADAANVLFHALLSASVHLLICCVVAVVSAALFRRICAGTAVAERFTGN